MAQCVNNFVPEKEMSAILFQFCSMLCYPFRVATAPVLESMQAREPGLQAPTKHENRLAGSGGDSRARATAAYGQNTAFMANLGPLSAPMATWNSHSRSENWFQQVLSLIHI